MILLTVYAKIMPSVVSKRGNVNVLDSIRFAFSVIVCRLLIFAGRIVHKGTSLPGEIVLKIYPKVLTKIKLPAVVIAVTGSNGKTSTSERKAATRQPE